MAITDNLVSYWRLEEASGQQRNDAFSTNHLSDNNTVPSSASGRQGNCAEFTAVNSEYLEIASNASLEIGAATFSGQAWIKLKSVGIAQVVLAKDIDTPANNRDFGLILNSDDDKPRFYVRGGAATVPWTAALTVDGTWHHVCFGMNLGAVELWIAVDGGTPATVFNSSGEAGTSSPFRIGARAFSGFQNYFDGYIDEVALWARDIRSDVAWLYNSGAGRSYTDLTGGGGASTTDGLLIIRGE